MSDAVRSVGDPIKSKCTKCRTVTRHLIVSLVGGEPARVQCDVCKGFHNYRAPAAQVLRPEPKGVAVRKTSRRSEAVSAVREEWQVLVAARNPEESIPYAATSGFQVGDLLDHRTFGLGLVRKTIRPDTVEVHFRDGIKRLRCNL